MKGCLGVLAVVLGFNLLIGSLFGTIVGCGYSHSEPEFSAWILKYGIMALLLGSLLCFVGVWLPFRGTKK
jgi:hypothetical protein